MKVNLNSVDVFRTMANSVFRYSGLITVTIPLLSLAVGKFACLYFYYVFFSFSSFLSIDGFISYMTRKCIFRKNISQFIIVVTLNFRRENRLRQHLGSPSSGYSNHVSHSLSQPDNSLSQPDKSWGIKTIQLGGSTD